MSIITLKDNTFIQKQQATEYQTQNKGGKGSNISNGVQILGSIEDESNIVYFTNFGRVLPNRGALPLEENERVVSFGNPTNMLFLITRLGTAKRVQLDKEVKQPEKVITLEENDELIQAKFTNGNDDLLILTTSGIALRVHEQEFSVVELSAVGVRAIQLKDDDSVVDCEIIDDNKQIVFVTQKGVGKRVNCSNFMPHHRNTNGSIAYKNGILQACVVPSDEVLIWSQNGKVIKLKSSDIPMRQNNISGGVILIRLDEKDAVQGICNAE